MAREAPRIDLSPYEVIDLRRLANAPSTPQALGHGSNQGNTRASAIRRQKALGSLEIGQNWPPADHPKVLPENGPF